MHHKLKKYNSYHTSIKQLAKKTKLPNKYSEFIDRSTIWRWKNENDDKYLGTELSKIDLLEKFLNRRESTTVIRAYLKLTATFSKIINESGQFQKILSGNKEKFVRSVTKYQNKINLKFVLRLCNVSTSVFYHWKHQVLYKCPSSPIQLCRRIYSNQLTEKEVNRMKEMLTNQRFRYWPVNNIVNVTLATWYNYIHKLGWERPKFPKKSKYGTGIRANRPHQIWHADITVVKCLNGMKYYVYLLMDNFSRFILNYQVSEKVSAKIRMESIRQAFEQYIKFPGEDIHELRKLLDWIIEDYQYKRPHHSLKGLTPYEALIGIPLPKEQWTKQIQEAKRIRLQQNVKEPCEIC